MSIARAYYDCESACAGDERQLWAAAELQRRDWFWHKVLQQWWKKEKVTQFVSQHNMVAMRGSFIAWDAKAWRAKRHPENTTVEEHVAELIPTLQALKAAKDLKAAPR
jgi:CCR4-NOT transcriptional regulation complex NOT5 subunit